MSGIDGIITLSEAIQRGCWIGLQGGEGDTDCPSMPTGVWSKRMRESTTPPGAGLGYASLMLVAVVGLGLRMKLQVAKQAVEFILAHHTERVAAARQAEAVWRAQRSGRRVRDSKVCDADAGRAGRESAHERHERAKREAEYARQGASEARRWLASADPLAEHRALLGVGRQATHAEIKAAYFRAAKRHHPDVNGADPAAAARFAATRTAYEALTPGAP